MSNSHLSVNLPRHDQVVPEEHRLGLGTVYPCAVSGVNINSAPAPDQRGWGPACDTSRLGTVTLSNGVKFAQRVELVELTTLIMNADIRDGYNYRQSDTGAYNCRNIAGTTTKSWHSWPVAIDKNWTTNPQHSPLITDYPVWLRQRWNRYGWRWGGNYNAPTVPDAMHHEFMGTPAQAAAATSLARSELGGSPPPPPPPSGGALPAKKQSPITGNMEIPGCDFSYTKPGALLMAAAGYTFAIGYVSPTDGKNLHPLEYQAYRNAEMAVGLVYESTAGRALQGSAAGSADGALADQQADGLGYPVDAVIFFAVDQDTTSTAYPAIQAYANAFNAATKRPVGIYGEADVVDHFVTPGVQPVQYGWQTAAWSGGRLSSKANLYQRVGHPGWPVPSEVASNAFDEDVAILYVPLAGWLNAPPPAPRPSPGSFASWPLPDGHYFGNVNGPAQSHGGYYPDEQVSVVNIQRWLVYQGCVDSVPVDHWHITDWADGVWQDETDAAMAAWHDRFYPGQQYPARCYVDDYVRLAVP
jgi:hypothetical protein